MKHVVSALVAVSALAVASASAAISTTEAQGHITTAGGHAETLGVAGFAIAGIWLVVAIVKKGILKAK